ncbi:hypothetical protein AAVH_21906 [Aphelenchoides avenae]|nr:hypothetical protein AAVH_21906 [Aphelenchus avenae]
MSASNANNAAVRRQVTCETSDNGQIAVYLDVLRLSRTFKKMYEDLALEEHDEFPGVFPVKTVSTRTFKKVMDWCTQHKVASELFLDAPEPVVEKDPLTQECTWFTFTASERRFFDVPMSALLELSVAAGIKGKHPRNICELLRQNCDLDGSQIRKTLDNNPWLKWAGVVFHQSPIEVRVLI